jgi:tetratricopeptide (TPR) repeat protein
MSPDGLLAASEASTGRFQLWDVATGQKLATWGGGSANNIIRQPIALVRDGRALLAGPVLFDVQSGQKIASPGYDGRVAAMAPDGEHVVTCGESSLYLWDAETGSGRQDFAIEKTARFNAVAFAPDGKHFVVGDNGGRIMFWDTATRKSSAPIDVGGHFYVNSVTYSPDGRYVLAGGMGQAVKLVDVAARKVIADFVGHTEQVTGVAFSPDGLMAASAGDDGTLRLWDVASSRSIHSFTAHAWGVNGLAFAPDGKSILTGGGDGFLRLWDFTRAATYRQFIPRLEAARLSVEKANAGKTAVDPSTLKTFGEWYAFRRQWDWAASLLEEARAGGTTVSPLLLARCNWHAGNLEAADREFTEAAALHEAPGPYLALCQQAVRAPLLQRQELAEALAKATKAIADKPDDPHPYADRAILYASDGRFGDALNDFIAADAIDATDGMHIYRIACLRLYLGDVPGYRRDCQQMLGRYASSTVPGLAQRVAKTCLLAPDASTDSGELLAIIDRTLAADTQEDKANSYYQWHLLSKGIGEFRSGRFEPAIEWLGKVHPLNAARDSTVDFFLAMAHHRLGHAEEARDALSKGVKLIDHWLPTYPTVSGEETSGIENWLICQIMRREAEGLIEGRPAVLPATRPVNPPTTGPASQPPP